MAHITLYLYNPHQESASYPFSSTDASVNADTDADADAEARCDQGFTHCYRFDVIFSSGVLGFTVIKSDKKHNCLHFFQLKIDLFGMLRLWLKIESVKKVKYPKYKIVLRKFKEGLAFKGAQLQCN